MRAAAAFLVTIVLTSSAVLAADDKCQLVEMASFNLGLDGAGRPYVPMSVAGQTLNMLVDTGGVATMMADNAVQRLGLNVLQMNEESRLRGFRGTKMDHYTVGHDISLGGLKAGNMPFIVTPRNELSDDEDGVLAPDVLRNYDIDFDFANAKLNLFSRDHCRGKVVYWTTGPYADVDIESDEGGHIVVPVELDGHRFMALIDTGASGSVMNWGVAKSAFGISETSPQVTTHSSSEATRAYRYPFKTLEIQDVTVNNPDIELYPEDVARMWSFSQTQVILGVEALRQLHLYVSYGERKLYVTAASAH